MILVANSFRLGSQQVTLSQMACLGAGLLLPIAVYFYRDLVLTILQFSLMPLFLFLILILNLVACPWSITRIEKALYHCVAKKRFLGEIARQGGLVEDQRIEDHVHRVGEKITAAAGQRVGSITFCVVNSKYIHAFAAYPKYVVVTMGMYQDFCNEDELASLLAHEVGHIVMNKRGGWAKQNLEECREEEYKADQLAVELTEKAGYDPSAYGQHHWRTMGYGHRMGQSIFRDDSSSTHPSHLKRITRLNEIQTVGNL